RAADRDHHLPLVFFRQHLAEIFGKVGAPRGINRERRLSDERFEPHGFRLFPFITQNLPSLPTSMQQILEISQKWHNSCQNSALAWGHERGTSKHVHGWAVIQVVSERPPQGNPLFTRVKERSGGVRRRCGGHGSPMHRK